MVTDMESVPTAINLDQPEFGFDTAVPEDKVAPVKSAPRHDDLPSAPANGLVPSLEKRRLQAYLAMVAADAIGIILSFALVALVYLGRDGNLARVHGGLQAAYLLLPLFLTIALYNGTYSRSTLTDWRKGCGKAIVSLLVSAALLNFFAFFAKMNAEFSRVVFTVGLGVTTVYMVGYRLAFSRWLTARWGAGASNRLVILAGGPRFTLPDALHVDAAEHGLTPDIDDPDSLDRLAKYLRNMDFVLVSSTGDDRLAWSEVLKGTGVQGELIDENSRNIGALGVVHHEEVNQSALLVSTGQLGMRARVLKRAFDLALTIPALLLLSPLLLLVALAIKLQDGGPVFFLQRRMGRGNHFFDIYKFRSMRQEEADASGQVSASRDDDRITPIGRLIRRTSIDELPQLINVLKGDMSLVGPRPHALGSKAGTKLFWQVDRKYWQRHGLRPGITGLAQVRGYRGATDEESDLANRLQADLEYMQGWNLWRDISILLRTASVVIHDRAY